MTINVPQTYSIENILMYTDFIITYIIRHNQCMLEYVNIEFTDIYINITFVCYLLLNSKYSCIHNLN